MFKMACFTKSKTESGKNQENVETNGSTVRICLFKFIGLLALWALFTFFFIFIGDIYKTSSTLLAPHVLKNLLNLNKSDERSDHLYKDADGKKGFSWFVVGQIVTSVAQSSSVVTSVTSSLISQGSISVQAGIFLVYGSNVGTTMTCNIMAFFFWKNTKEFKRAFAVSSFHTLFNLCTAFILVFVEWFPHLFLNLGGPMEYVVTHSVTKCEFRNCQEATIRLISREINTNPILVNNSREMIYGNGTKPSSDAISFRDLNEQRTGLYDTEIERLIDKIQDCRYDHYVKNVTCTGCPKVTNITEGILDKTRIGLKAPLYEKYHLPLVKFTMRVPDLTNTKSMIAECKEANHLFCDWYGYGDDLGAGVIIFCIAAILLMLDLFVLYKLGKCVLPIKTRFEERGFCNNIILNDHLNNIIMFLLGFFVTIGLQSSSVATSLLVIPVAKEYLNLRNAYFVILGMNLGTTITDIFSYELYEDIESLTCSKGYLQIFMAHLLFNLCGCIMFCLPVFQAPYRIGRAIAGQVDAYRWLVIVFFLLVYVVFPLINLPFSMASPLIFFIFYVAWDFIVAIIFVINYFQVYQNGRYLPYWIQNWNFLPLWMRSFDPAHNFFMETWTSLTRIPHLCDAIDLEGRSSFGMKDIVTSVAESETR